jgi:hypothetical protein
MLYFLKQLNVSYGIDNLLSIVDKLPLSPIPL